MLHGAHKQLTDALAAKVWTNPQPFDLAGSKIGIADRPKTNAANRMALCARDEKRPPRWKELVDVEVLVFFAAAVATIQFVDRGVKDGEGTVGRDGFIVNDRLRHQNTVGVGPADSARSLRCEDSLKEIHVSPRQR